MIAMMRAVIGHSPWVVLPTLLAALLVGLAATRPVVAQQTNTVQCSSASTIVSGSSNVQVAIPDMGVASTSVQVPAFTGVYVQAIVLTLSLSHPNLRELEIVLATPNGNKLEIKGSEVVTILNSSTSVDGDIQFYNGDCSEYSTLPLAFDAIDGGTGPFKMADPGSIQGAPGNANIVNGVYSILVADRMPGGTTGFIKGLEVKIVGQKGELLGSSSVQVMLLSALVRYLSVTSQQPSSVTRVITAVLDR
jgi:subtilisin-like proprotein convertase family protein